MFHLLLLVSKVVYYAHATNPVTFGTLLLAYYLSIPVAVILWFATSYGHIRKGNLRLKRLALYLFLAFITTSLSAYKMASIYFYIHSPGEGYFCLTSSCVLSSSLLREYRIDPQTLESHGVPSFGPMAVYRVYDTGKTPTLGLQVRMDYLVIIRPMMVLPSAEVDVYHLSKGRAVKREKFYITWPSSPGGVLTNRLGAKFTVFIITEGGGAGA